MPVSLSGARNAHHEHHAFGRPSGLLIGPESKPHHAFARTALNPASAAHSGRHMWERKGRISPPLLKPLP